MIADESVIDRLLRSYSMVRDVWRGVADRRR